MPRGNPKLEPFKWTKEILSRKIIRVPMTAKSIRVLSSPADIRNWQQITNRDPKDPTRGCLMIYLIDRESGLEGDIKFFQNQSEAEDVLGLVMIFPESKSHETIEYISQ